MTARLHKYDPILHARAFRALANRKEHSGEGVLERVASSGEPLILGLIEGRQLKVHIKSTTKYDFELEEGPRAKREVLYTFSPKTAKKLKKVIGRDKEIAAFDLKPPYRVRSRMWISKMILQRFIDESLKARFTLIDGTVRT